MIVVERMSWLSMVLAVRGSVMPRVMPRVLAVTAVSIALTLVQRFNTQHLTLTVTPFLIVSLPLGIILGFRNTASYDRFWEGRKLWGALVNSCRSLGRQLDMFVRDTSPSARARHRPSFAPSGLTPGFVSGDADQALSQREAAAEVRRAANYRLIAFAHALRMHLRREHDEATLRPLLGEEEVVALRHVRCPPAAILHRLGSELADAAARGLIRRRDLRVCEAALCALTDVVGGCERIKNTPTPMSYLVFIHRAVAFYCVLLPFGVAETVHSLTPVVVFFVSYALFSLDAIGDELDDPFRGTENTLPLATLARNVEIEARARLGETDLPTPLTPVDGVLR